MSGNVWYISVSKKKIEFKKYPSKQKNKKTVKKSNQKFTNSSKKLLINLILASSFIFFLNMVSAAGINDTFHINLQSTFSNGTIETGIFTFAFNITENSDSSCLGPIVYNHSVQKTTDTRGIVSLYLPTIGSGGGDLSALSFDKQYYLCYYRDGTLKDVSQLGRVPYAFRATQVNLSEISVDSNLTMPDYNISADYGFFNFLGSLINNITSLFVEDIDVSGNIDVNGGWMNDGLTISGGDIWAQTVYVYNITSLNVSKQNLTIIDDMIVYGNTELKKNLTVADTLFVDSDTDRVGIGTISPTHELTVIGTVNATSFIGDGSQLTDISGTNASLNYGYNGSTWVGLSTTHDGILKIKTISEYSGAGWSVSGTYVYNDTAGVTIGIGTATPQNELNVIGDINFTELIYGNGSQLTGITTTETDPLWTGNETNVARTGDCPAGQVVMNTTTGGVECTLASATFETNVSILYGKNTSSSLIVPIEVADNGALKLSVTDLGEDVGWMNVGANVFLETITDSVGIGTITPQNKLNVIGDGNFTGNSFVGENLSVYGNLIVAENATFQKDVIIEGILYGGSPLNIGSNVNVNGNLTVDYYFGNGSQLTDVGGIEVDPYWTGNQSLYYLKSNLFGFYNSTNPQTETDPFWTANQSSYWDTSTDLDTVISDDEIAEGKIAFSTACATGNHYYLNGNDLACEADAVNDAIYSGATFTSVCSECVGADEISGTACSTVCTDAVNDPVYSEATIQSVCTDCIEDSQLLYNTGQALATSSTPQFARLGLGAAADGTYLLNLNGAKIHGTSTGFGIGATTPLSKLHLAANNDADGFLRLENTGNSRYSRIYHDSEGLNFDLSTSGDEWIFKSDAGEALSIVGSTGNVKIMGMTILGNYTSKPTCNIDYVGGMVFDTVIGRPFVCDGTNWNPMDSKVIATGQVSSIYTDDDGDYQKGCTRSYTDNGDGTSTDQCTGLMWCKDGNSACANSGSTADGMEASIAVCEGLTYATHSDWRLPNVNELWSIVQAGYNPRVNTTFFTNNNGYYWSSTAIFGGGDNGYIVKPVDAYLITTYLGNWYYVRCVRGG